MNVTFMKFLNFFYIFFLLSISVYSQEIADQWDPFDDSISGAIELPAPTNSEQSHGPHSLSADDQADWFELQLNAGETYHFFSTGDSDTIGELVAPSGVLRLTQNQGTFENPNFQIFYTPDFSGKYFIKVSLAAVNSFPGPGEISAANRGEYTLVYKSGEITLPPRDQWDPEDDVFQDK